jgi:hypothetical protein
MTELTETSRYMQGITTVAEGHTRILGLLEEIAELNKDIDYYEALAKSGGAPYDECMAARSNAIMDRNFNRDAIKYIEHWIREEDRRGWEVRQSIKLQRMAAQSEKQAKAQAEKAAKPAKTKEQTDEERATGLAYKKATIDAIRMKNELRAIQIEREQHMNQLIESVSQDGLLSLVAEAGDLLIRLTVAHGIEHSPQDQGVIDAIKKVVSVVRNNQMEAA